MKVFAEEGWTQKYAALRWREATDLEVCVNLQRKGGEDSGSGCYVEHGGCWTVGPPLVEFAQLKALKICSQATQLLNQSDIIVKWRHLGISAPPGPPSLPFANQFYPFSFFAPPSAGFHLVTKSRLRNLTKVPPSK